MDRALEISGLLIGLLYLYWEYHADWRLWIASVVMPVISLFVYWRAGLYADFGIDIYYLLIALYGFWQWRHAPQSAAGENLKEELPVTHVPGKMWLLLAAAFLILYLGLAWLLLNFTDSTVPWWDALNTALSVVAMWMLARKWVEQWIVWLVVDAVSVGLYVYKDIPFYAILYAFYTVIAWFGYLKWRKLVVDC